MTAQQTALFKKIEDAYAEALESADYNNCVYMTAAKEHLRVALSNMICLKLRSDFRNPPPDPNPTPDADDDGDDDDTAIEVSDGGVLIVIALKR